MKVEEFIESSLYQRYSKDRIKNIDIHVNEPITDTTICLDWAHETKKDFVSDMDLNTFYINLSDDAIEWFKENKIRFSIFHCNVRVSIDYNDHIVRNMVKILTVLKIYENEDFLLFKLRWL